MVCAIHVLLVVILVLDKVAYIIRTLTKEWINRIDYLIAAYKDSIVSTIHFSS